MHTITPAAAAERSGLIWGFDFAAGQVLPLHAMALPEAGGPGLRWLHLNLADQRAHRWIAACSALPQAFRDLLLSPDGRAHALFDGDGMAMTLQDMERDFDDGEPRLGWMRLALMPGLMITARRHPVRSADVLRERIAAGAAPATPAEALELLLGSMAESARRLVTGAEATVQTIEDDLLDRGATPDARAFVTLRSMMVRLHRLLAGGRALMREVADHAALPAGLDPVLDKAGQRLAALDAELQSVQSQLRLLREEIDLQAAQRTNQNLYVLSILTALMLPATLVTGIFGMNTGGLPWQGHPLGTMLATGLAIGSAAIVYLILRLTGFMRR